jgi:hypothetical protein
MIAAGTNAPIAIDAKATPTNQDGNDWTNNAGTAKFGPYSEKPAANSGFRSTPAAMAMNPSNAIKPTRNE